MEWLIFRSCEWRFAVYPGSFLGDFFMPSDQISFTALEHANRLRVSRRV